MYQVENDITNSILQFEKIADAVFFKICFEKRKMAISSVFIR